MRVLWTVSGYYVGNDAGMSEDAARALLFKPLDIGETWITFDGQRCGNVEFTHKIVNIHDYLEKVWHMSPLKFNIDDHPAKIFSTNCEIPLFREYVRLQDGRLIAKMNGVLLFFEPNIDR